MLCLGLMLSGAGAFGSDGTEASAPTSPPRAAVVAVHDSSATSHFIPHAEVVQRMVDRGLISLSGKASAAEAWRELISASDTVGFKVTSGPGEVSGTRLAVVRALVESLRASGHPSDRIVIWDKRANDLRNAGWNRLADELGVRCLASEEAGWDADPERSYEKPVLGRLVAGDSEFSRKDEPGVGRRSFVTRLLTRETTKIIPVTPVLNHNAAGVNGQLIGLALSSVDNTLRFANNSGLLPEAVPEIVALDDLFPKIAFGVSDALLCQYRGEETTRLHNTTALNELRFSRDPVALDVLAIADIENARGTSSEGLEARVKTDLYTNAELLELGVADLKRIDVKRVDL